MNDYLASKTELHKAMAAANNLNNLADWYYAEYSAEPTKVLGATSVSQFRRLLSQHSYDYALIRDVSDAHKHLRLNRPDRFLTSAGQSSVTSLGWGSARWGDARWGSPAEVVIIDDAGKFHHFRALCLRVQEMWEHMLGIS